MPPLFRADCPLIDFDRTAPRRSLRDALAGTRQSGKTMDPARPAHEKQRVQHHSIERTRHDRAWSVGWRREMAAEGQSVCDRERSEEHTSELQSLMRISYAVFCLKKKTHTQHTNTHKQSGSNIKLRQG